MTNSELEQYYYRNQDDINDAWDMHLSENDWGSGEDKIIITEGMFWEFVEGLKDTNRS